MLVTEAIDRVPIADALPGGVQPCGSLLLEAQGQHDLALAQDQAAKLAESAFEGKAVRSLSLPFLSPLSRQVCLVWNRRVAEPARSLRDSAYA
jgi:hypothetical protein